MAESVVLGSRLRELRHEHRLSQEDVADLLGVSRALISHFERDERRPGERMLERLAQIYGVDLQHLVDPEVADRPADLTELLFRDAEGGIGVTARDGLRQFVRFLDDYARLIDRLGADLRFLHQSPFSIRRGFTGKEDIRRKAEEASDWLRLGLGPVGDLPGLLDEVGITVYRLPLGDDLEESVSGAFVSHPSLGLCLAVNVQTTPGRQTFTIAHELAHALYHSDTESRVVSYFARRDSKEWFADNWAGEFLVPLEALRRAAEGLDLKTISEAEQVVHLQRHFGVSYHMMLVRLLIAGLLDRDTYERLRAARPVVIADRLGYQTDPEEWSQQPRRWRLERFPQRFVRLLRQALQDRRISPPSAAELTGLTPEEMTALMAPAGAEERPATAEEDEYRDVRDRIAG